MENPKVAENSFLAVCNNESLASYRDMERVLSVVVNALLEGWTPPMQALTGPSKRRAGYLLEMMADWLPEHRLPQQLTQQVQQAAKEVVASHEKAVPFFHADLPAPKNYDELAVKWGLSRGLDYSRLKQLVRTGIV